MKSQGWQLALCRWNVHYSCVDDRRRHDTSTACVLGTPLYCEWSRGFEFRTASCKLNYSILDPSIRCHPASNHRQCGQLHSAFQLASMGQSGGRATLCEIPIAISGVAAFPHQLRGANTSCGPIRCQMPQLVPHQPYSILPRVQCLNGFGTLRRDYKKGTKTVLAQLIIPSMSPLLRLARNHLCSKRCPCPWQVQAPLQTKNENLHLLRRNTCRVAASSA